MKTVKNLAIFCSIAGLIFAGCKKDSTNMEYNADIIKPASNASILYILNTWFPTSNGIIQWTDGYITSNEILFNGSHIVGNSLSLEKFPGNVNETINFSGARPIGYISVPYKSFDHVSFSISLLPLNDIYAFFLAGSYVQGNKTTPIMLIMNQPMSVASNWLNNISINNLAYAANLYLDLNVVNNKITPDMLASAQLTDGRIIISSSSNANLYQLINDNLQTAMTVQFNALPLTTSSALPERNTANPSH